MNNLFFLAVKCKKTKANFHARFDFAADDVWALTAGVKDIPKGQSLSSNSLEIDISNLRIGPQYRCPDCGNTTFVQCGNCSKYTCWNGSSKFYCAHCGSSGEVSGSITTARADKSGWGQ